MLEFCTYFDRNYLLQALALHRSLARHASPFRLWMLCLDDESFELVERLDLPSVRTLSEEMLLADCPDLAAAREDRSRVEFYYACTPALTQYALDRGANPDGVSYIDADMFFFGDPGGLYSEADDVNVRLVEHRCMDPAIEEEHGRFNVCAVHFAQTDEARDCLRWWAEQTLASTRLGDGVWGDQGYLDHFPRLFSGVETFDGATVGLAPWNLFRHTIAQREGNVLVDGRPLIAYHFARYLFLSPRTFIPIRRTWIPRHVLDAIYAPYHVAMNEALAAVRRLSPAYRVGYTARNLRGVALGLVGGRMFVQRAGRLRRIGVYMPSTREELHGWNIDRAARR